MLNRATSHLLFFLLSLFSIRFLIVKKLTDWLVILKNAEPLVSNQLTLRMFVSLKIQCTCTYWQYTVHCPLLTHCTASETGRQVCLGPGWSALRSVCSTYVPRMEPIKLPLYKARPPCGTSDITAQMCESLYVCVSRWGYVYIQYIQVMFVCAFMFADVCLCVHMHVRLCTRRP